MKVLTLADTTKKSQFAIVTTKKSLRTLRVAAFLSP